MLDPTLLRQNPTELEDLAQNRWPVYRPQDHRNAQIGTVGYSPW